jgi:hypothetical protein
MGDSVSTLIFPIDDIGKKVTFDETVKVRIYKLTYEERLAKHLHFNYTVSNMQKNIQEVIYDMKDRSLNH